MRVKAGVSEANINFVDNLPSGDIVLSIVCDDGINAPISSTFKVNITNAVSIFSYLSVLNTSYVG